MSMLNSPYTGKLTKSGTITKTQSSSGYLASSIDCSRFNTVKIKITINSGASSNNRIQLTGNLSNSDLRAVDLYRLDTVNGNFEIKDSVNYVVESGVFIQDVSNLNYINFYVNLSSEISVTIDYVLSNDNFNDDLHSIRDIVKQSAQREVLITTLSNVDLTTTGNHTITIPELPIGYKSLRVNVSFNQADDDVVLLSGFYSGSKPFPTQGSVWLFEPIIREDGIIVGAISKIGSILNYNYYIDQIPSIINLRCDTAGASGLKANISVYAVDYIPTLKHIQPLYEKEFTITGSEQQFDVNLSDLPIKKCKFFYCYVGSSYNKTGSISKNYAITDDNGINELIDFADEKIAVTKWLPITAIDGAKITFKVTSAVTGGKDKVAIYGVV